jgi:hypothetical protein
MKRRYLKSFKKESGYFDLENEEWLCGKIIESVDFAKFGRNNKLLTNWLTLFWFFGWSDSQVFSNDEWYNYYFLKS